MKISLRGRLKQKITNWLLKDYPPNTRPPLSNFERIRYEVRPCDVLLVEGFSRVSYVIKTITQSPWSHSMLYIGRLNDIDDPILRARIQEFYKGDLNGQLVIESILGKGTVVTNIEEHRNSHIRICRPKSISRQDSQKVMGFAIKRLGRSYAVRHVIDLARFLLPWSILPRRWHSSLFENNISKRTEEICSSMLAEAFNSVQFPILPVIKQDDEKGIQLYQRNPRLFTPSDFDYSPYFEIVKYPFFELAEHIPYRELPWNDQVISDPSRDTSQNGKIAATTASSSPIEELKSTTDPEIDKV